MNRTIINKKIVWAALLCACLLACAKSKEQTEVLNAVKSYNASLINAYRDVTTNYLVPVASPEEVKKILAVMQAMAAMNSRMIAVQDTFKVSSVTVSGSTAKVRAKETWTYWWEDVNTRAITKPKAVQEYNLVYNMKKAHGRWIVDSLSPG